MSIITAVNKFSVTEFQAKFGVHIPLYVQEPGMRTWSTERCFWFFQKYKALVQPGGIFRASEVTVEVSSDGGEFDLHVIYNKIVGTRRGLVTPISSFLAISSEGTKKMRFSDYHIRGKLEIELGKLPPRKGNFVCSCCAIDTGNQEYCSGCSAPSYWAPEGGGVRYSGEMTYEFE